ncbi:MAG: GNAT family N-acetyltransferase [Gammaproteobacteria bacterium]|jgi:hypothetical protein
MTEFFFSRTASPQYNELCDRDGALFHTARWQAMLERSFGVRSQYFWNGRVNCGGATSEFKAGPFRVGYIGFPVGGALGQDALDIEELRESWRQDGKGTPTCLRLPVSAFTDTPDLPFRFDATPETAVCDLQNWDLSKVSKKLRRDIKKAQRSRYALGELHDPHLAPRLFDMYRQTVDAHDGAMRYNETYFRELVGMAEEHPGLSVLVARLEDDIAGFVVMAYHRSVAYYLHGGSDPRFRHLSPSDILLNAAIHQARDDHCVVFNFMSSPKAQPSLVRYKEKWGAETREHRTYTVGMKPSYVVFRIAEAAYRAAR